MASFWIQLLLQLTTLLCVAFFSCSVDVIGMVFDPSCSTVVSLGISAEIGVSSMLAVIPREKLKSLLFFYKVCDLL